MQSLQTLWEKPVKPEAPFFLIAGPCVVENREVLHQTASVLTRVCRKFGIPLIFKSSFTKANRSSLHSFTGIGDQEALELLAEIRETFQIPVVTDIHRDEEAMLAAKYVDMLQIPAFLCRQTSLLQAAAKTGKPVNIKKGQFLAPDSMRFAAEKVRESGNPAILLTERGTCFGYQDLVVDFRSIPIMKEIGYPVVMDCTHSLQQPNQQSGVTGGKPEFIHLMAKCALVAGADGLFVETHPNPESALSDGANMLNINIIEPLIEQWVHLRSALSPR